MATNWRYYLDFLTAPLVALVLLILAFPINNMKLSAFALGYFSWVMFEWWFHAKLLHRRYRREHWVHHKRPSDIHVNEQLPWQLTNGLLAAGSVFTVTLAGPYGAAFAAALALGYLSYIGTHHALHQGLIRPTTPFLGAVVRRHELHHRGVEANFNVLCPLGDHLMGTYVKA